MAYWLVKTEPTTYSIDNLAKDGSTAWTGVRNYQARNYLKEMRVGDTVLVYHSNVTPPAVVGIARVATAAKPDPTQFDRRSDYFDEKATAASPRWFCPDLEYVRTLKSPVLLDMLRKNKALVEMPLLQRGARLSVMPVSEKQFKVILEMSKE